MRVAYEQVNNLNSYPGSLANCLNTLPLSYPIISPTNFLSIQLYLDSGLVPAGRTDFLLFFLQLLGESVLFDIV